MAVVFKEKIGILAEADGEAAHQMMGDLMRRLEIGQVPDP